jgi:hypothetical protein
LVLSIVRSQLIVTASPPADAGLTLGERARGGEAAAAEGARRVAGARARDRAVVDERDRGSATQPEPVVMPALRIFPELTVTITATASVGLPADVKML